MSYSKVYKCDDGETFDNENAALFYDILQESNIYLETYKQRAIAECLATRIQTIELVPINEHTNDIGEF